ncbi:hypothetical protein CU633_00470 [Bacillus sp. V3-13]|nr:hypothetical protein CU633_00470 [Bacillus sp. V3-13]
MLVIKSPFWFSFIAVLIIVLLINFVAQTYLMKKNNYKVKWKSVVVLVFQSLLITLLLNWL